MCCHRANLGFDERARNLGPEKVGRSDGKPVEDCGRERERDESREQGQIVDEAHDRDRFRGRDAAHMTRILVMSDTTLPLAEIKKRLSEIVDGVEARHDRVVLTRNGRPAAVLISPEDLESLEETLEILSDPEAVRAIRSAEAEIDAGSALDARELRAKYLKR